MHRFALAVVVALAVNASPAAAADGDDAAAVVKKFIDSFNKGDVASALGTCASPAFVVDEVPPYAWSGPTACADWVRDLEAAEKKAGITDGKVTLGKPRHVFVEGDRAYVVAPATYDYKEKGKKVSQKGATLTVALQKTAAGWKMTAWAWSTGKV